MTTTDNWTKIDDRESAISFWRAATRSLMSGTRERCPKCSLTEVKFYAHHFDSDRSALWVWCSECRVWTVTSNMKIEFSFDDPYEGYSPDRLAKLERSNWLTHLDQLFSSGKLPQTRREDGQR